MGMGRAAIALVTSAAFIAGCSTSWPRPVAAVDPALANHAAAVARIDLLPVDLAVWTDGRRGDPEIIRQRSESALAAAVTTALYQRGYLPGAQIDWNGSYAGDDGTAQPALAPAELLGTVEVLSSYGLEVSQRGGLPQPPLPARLGASGAEATLYVGGWSFVGEEPASGGTKTLTVIAIAAVVIIAVIAIVAVSRSKSSSKGGDSVLSNAAGSVVNAAAATGRVALRGLARAGNVAIEVGRVAGSVADTLVRPHRGGPFSRYVFDPDFDMYVTSRDPYGPPAWYPTAPPPPWEQRPTAPRKGRSALYLEMTLVDNRDGRVLWHVAQRFPASGARDAEVTRAAQAMLSTLPAIR